MKKYKIVDRQYNSKDCIVCGLESNNSLKTSFYITDTNELIAIATPLYSHQSYPNRMHGGVIAALLDETIGRSISDNKENVIWGVTIELTTRYKLPVPLDDLIRVVGRITVDHGKYFQGTGELYLADGKIAATAIGKYMKLPVEKITDQEFRNNQWGLLPQEDMPEYIEI